MSSKESSTASKSMPAEVHKMAEADYLPGCYWNFRCHAEESFAGYLLRLAEGNDYLGIGDFLQTTLAIKTRSLDAALLLVRTEPALLQSLGRIATGEPELLARYTIKAYQAQGASPALAFDGVAVDADALLGANAQVCPKCLAESGYAHEAWDLAPVTVCTHHEVILVDACTLCGTKLTWKRPQLLFCGECGADLRQIAVEPASAPSVRAAADFGAIARFRVRYLGSEVGVEMWDTCFKMVRALALSARHWADREWPRGFFLQFVRIAAAHVDFAIWSHLFRWELPHGSTAPAHRDFASAAGRNPSRRCS